MSFPALDARSRRHDDLDAPVCLIPECFVAVRGVGEFHPMRNDERRINLPLLDAFEERAHISMHMSLAHFHRESFIHGRPKRDLIQESEIHAGY
jgi:hypothetical protein